MFNVNLQQTDPIFEGHEVGSATTSSPTPTPLTKASMSSAKVVQVARNFLCACGARQGLEIRVGGKHLDKSMPCRGTFKYPSRTIVIWDLLFHAQSSLFQSTNLAGLFSLSHAYVGMVRNHSDYYDFRIINQSFFPEEAHVITIFTLHRLGGCSHTQCLQCSFLFFLVFKVFQASVVFLFLVSTFQSENEAE